MGLLNFSGVSKPDFCSSPLVARRIRHVIATSLLTIVAMLPGRAPREALASDAPPTATPSASRWIILKPDESRFRLLPLTNYVNTAFDTAQVSRAFSQDNYWRNHETVLDRIVRPFKNIEDDGGWDHFFRQEFASGAVLPNLTLHLLGNSYDFRALAEWYDAHRVPWPYFWAFVTSYAGYIGNEAIEVSNPEVEATDSIADLYLFNFFGNLLFISDTVTDVVHNQWQLRNWPGQPVFDMRRREIRNASNNYVMRPDLGSEHVRPFLYMGLHYFAGLSLSLPAQKGLSLGAGLATTDPFANDVLDKVQPSGGLFWDDDNRLLASMVFHGTDKSIARLNVYPDLLHSRIIDLGIFLGVEHNGVPTFGIAIEKLLAFGLS